MVWSCELLDRLENLWRLTSAPIPCGGYIHLSGAIDKVTTYRLHLKSILQFDGVRGIAEERAKAKEGWLTFCTHPARIVDRGPTFVECYATHLRAAPVFIMTPRRILEARPKIVLRPEDLCDMDDRAWRMAKKKIGNPNQDEEYRLWAKELSRNLPPVLVVPIVQKSEDLRFRYIT